MDGMAHRIGQLYDTFAIGTGNYWILRISVWYGRRYVLLQTSRFLAALLLNHWAALSGGPLVTWLLSVSHKVIIGDVAWLDTRRDAVRDSTWDIFTTVGVEDVICSVGNLSAAEYEGIVAWYRRGYLCYTILARWK